MNGAETHWYEKALAAEAAYDAAMKEAERRVEALRSMLERANAEAQEARDCAHDAEASNVRLTKEVQELRELLRREQVENAACAKAALKPAKRKILSIYIEDETT